MNNTDATRLRTLADLFDMYDAKNGNIGMDEVQTSLRDIANRIESSHAHRLRLIESVKKWGGAWRKCRAELKEAKRRIAELECQSKDSRNLNSEFYKCNVCGNTPAVIVFTDKGTFCKEHAEYK